MNWSIAFKIWLRGLGIFAFLCLLFFPIGLIALLVAILISWLAIPIYAISLWVFKKVSMSHVLAMAVMLILPTAASVLAALFFGNCIDHEIVSDDEAVTFWVPLTCCMLSVIFSGNLIHNYLYPEAGMEKIATE